MVVRTIRTDRILPGSVSLFGFLDKYLGELKENTVVAITSKIVSLCEGRVIKADKADKEKLSIAEADYYFPAELSKYNHHFTIVHDTILGMSGIDESNGGGYYILLPKYPQQTANHTRKYIKDKHSLNNVGVIITDSVSIPLRLGAVGASIGYSGFKAVKDYRGKADLFGRPFIISQSNVAAGLAAAAVAAMGEGTEQTPLAIINDVPFVEFNNKDPSATELKTVNLSIVDDLFAPFLDNGKWRKGGSKNQ